MSLGKNNVPTFPDLLQGLKSSGMVLEFRFGPGRFKCESGQLAHM